jgi:hypothetical protein
MKAYVFNSKKIVEIEACDFSAGNYKGNNFCWFMLPNDNMKYCLSFFNDVSDSQYKIFLFNKPTKNQIKKLRKFLGEDICLRSSIWKCLRKIFQKG